MKTTIPTPQFRAISGNSFLLNFGASDAVILTNVVVPEPGSAVLLAVAGAGLLARRRRAALPPLPTAAMAAPLMMLPVLLCALLALSPVARAETVTGNYTGTINASYIYIGNGALYELWPTGSPAIGESVNGLFSYETAGATDSDASAEIGLYQVNGSFSWPAAAEPFYSGPLTIQITNGPESDGFSISYSVTPPAGGGQGLTVAFSFTSSAFASDVLPTSFAFDSGVSGWGTYASVAAPVDGWYYEPGSTVGNEYYFTTSSVQAVPEPGSAALLAVAGVGLLARRRRGAPCLRGRPPQDTAACSP